jgi:hypothetical protein
VTILPFALMLRAPSVFVFDVDVEVLPRRRTRSRREAQLVSVCVNDDVQRLPEENYLKGLGLSEELRTTATQPWLTAEML